MMILGTLIETVLTEDTKIDRVIESIYDKYLRSKSSKYYKDLEQIMKLTGSYCIQWATGENVLKDIDHSEPIGDRLIHIGSYRNDDKELTMCITVSPKKFSQMYAIDSKKAVDQLDNAIDSAIGKAIQRLKREYKIKER